MTCIDLSISIDGNLFNALKTDANKLNRTVSDYLITLLDKLYEQTPFDYETALNTLEKEAESLPPNTYFSLVQLSSFRNIPVARAERANLRPSIIRARLGKMFNRRVASGMVSGVSRATDSSGGLIFDHRAAVYKRR